MFATRSATGCLACKTKRKKCDETKPHCLRCQKSRTECPGYTYIQNPNRSDRRPRTLPGPRTVVGQSRGAPLQETHLMNAEEPKTQRQGRLLLGYELVPSDPSCSVTGSSVIPNARALSEAIDISNNFSSTGALYRSSIDVGPSDRPVVNTKKPDPVPTFRNTGTAAPMTSGQASLMEALLSLGQPVDLDPSQPGIQPPTRPTISLLSKTDPLAVTKWSLHDPETQDDVATHKSGNLEGAVGMIYTQPVLDRAAESNALPFVLQSYAAWIDRIAIEPLHLTRLARDFVFSHFEDGEQSRWIVVLLANIGSKVGSVDLVETKSRHLLSMLPKAVRRRLATVKLLPSPKQSELVKALDFAIEAMLIHIYAGPLTEVMTLRQEAAPIFRQLCPDPPDTPIDLHSLLQHPLRCLRHYADLDVTFSVVTDIPTLFRYDVAIADSEHSDIYRESHGDSIIQWRDGMPNQMVLSFAKMKSMHQDGVTPNGETVALLERGIREVPPFNGSSSGRFVTVMRSVVQECWRQAAYIYLYMAVCGDPCDTPRVKQAFKRYLKLLQGTKPGRLPDEFLILTLLLISPAAEQKSEREIIRQRILGLYTRSKAVRDNYIGIFIIEDYWARADAEGRPTMWSDVAASRIRVVGM
ncbi:unnamed protein product [Rhizoctonia solani]|uniref:Zn(2)-C6 fungal-type domain-containing protein n=1 Tax=Rhizoctonia solani TaxID=456999 RepID=A0A8H3HDV5_9AGAM|nr:unnamed protein product [Rhizoctonia solani]